MLLDPVMAGDQDIQHGIDIASYDMGVGSNSVPLHQYNNYLGVLI